MGKQDFVKEYFDDTNKYLNNNLVIQFRKTILERNLFDRIGCEIVDIGCGDGQISFNLLENNRITFIDISPKMLNLLKSKIPFHFKDNANIYLGDFNKISIQNRFDIALCFGVLAHVESIDESIRNLNEIVKEKGLIIFQYTNQSKIISKTLRLIGWVKNLFRKSYPYKVNYIKERDINQVLESLQLVCQKRVYYWDSLPGFFILPIAIRRLIFFKILNSPFLSRFGGECIVFAEKKCSDANLKGSSLL